MNSQLAQAEVIQSSQPYVLCEVLIQSVIKKRHGGITVTTAFDRGGIFGLYALCYKIFFLNILWTCGAFFWLHLHGSNKLPVWSWKAGMQIHEGNLKSLEKKSVVTNQSFCLGWSLQKLTSACQAYVCIGCFCGEKAKLLLLWGNSMHAFFPSKVREVKRGVKKNWALNRAKQTDQKTCIL